MVLTDQMLISLLLTFPFLDERLIMDSPWQESECRNTCIGLCLLYECSVNVFSAVLYDGCTASSPRCPIEPSRGCLIGSHVRFYNVTFSHSHMRSQPSTLTNMTEGELLRVKSCCPFRRDRFNC